MSLSGLQVAKLLGEKWRALDGPGKAGYQAAAAEQALAVKKQQQQQQQRSESAPAAAAISQVCSGELLRGMMQENCLDLWAS